MKADAARDLEREALARLSRVHGSGELQAAILALISPKDSAPAFIAWSRETQHVPNAALLRQDVTHISDGARVPCLEAFLDRMREQPRPDRRLLLESTRRVMAATRPLRPLDRLHWLLMRRKLGDRAPLSAPPAPQNDVAELSSYMVERVAGVTAYLARMVPGPGPEAGLPWYRDVMLQLVHTGEPPPCKAPDGEGLAYALIDVESLPWMLRPVLMRGWVDAALATSQRARLLPVAADALRLVSGLLDSPMSPELMRHFQELDWAPAAAAAPQQASR